MKYLTIIALSFWLLSCSSAKNVTENTLEEKKEVVQVTIPKASKTPKIPQNTEKTTITTQDTLVESKPFKQVLTQRFFKAHQLWDELLKKHVSDKGNVNYQGFKRDHKELLGYIKILQLSIPTDTTSTNDKLAYWINAYNALTVDLILRNYPLKSIKDIKNPWDQRLWQLGSKWYTLNEIEHQILRKMNEPRIHFGIVCASYSCPKLLNEAYTTHNLDTQLTKVTKEFLQDPERNNIAENSIKLSKIFKWFAKDFKTEGSIIDFLNKYTDISISKDAKKSFKDYNWALNE